MPEESDIAEGIAIVGMAGRFPGASNTRDFWRLLNDGHEATRWYTDEELMAEGVSTSELKNPNYIRAGNPLADMEMFDAGFFGFSPREASIMDPQHRHFLEASWEVLEDAGHMPETFPGAIGVFAGSGMQAYMAFNILSNQELVEDIGLFLLRHTGNDKDFMPTRVSYLLNLQGPSIAIQTACSTSLVAVHQACQSLLMGECDMALAGGSTIELPHRRGYQFTEGEILSPDGHCRAFDDSAAGTLFGSGVGVVALRRLEDALADNDNIHAIIRGTAINNDGSQKAGYLAPSVDGQAQAAAEALSIAGVDARSVGYLEAHGTGTPVGDPIELSAMAQAYGGDKQFCGIGSVKTNIGHLDTAAGVASLIKVVLALKNETIPASLNFSKPNSHFNLADSPFYVVDEQRNWPRGDAPRRAGVNSIGVGGTNAHAIIEEAPQRAAADKNDNWKLFTISAKTDAALDGLMAKWGDYLDSPAQDFSLSDAAYTTQVGRRAFQNRCGVLAKDIDGLKAAMRKKETRRLAKGTATGTAPDVVFMFPGGGAQFPGVGRELYETVPAFRETVDACFRDMPAEAPSDLREVMFAGDESDKVASATLEKPRYAIPALFVLELALARMWESWGVKPAAVIGHSAGEYAAAVIAGVMKVEDALSLVVLRGILFEKVPEGAMSVVQLSEAEIQEFISDQTDIAAVNAPDMCVVSGTIDTIESVEAKLEERGLEARRLRINVAAHSRLLDEVLDQFRAKVATVNLSTPRLPFVSNLSGGWAESAELTDPDYWVRQLRNTVRFADGIRALLADGQKICLEVGPGQNLGALARINASHSEPVAVLSSTRQPQEQDSDLAYALTTAASIWAHGGHVDLHALRGGTDGNRISLPTYAFEKERHWIEPGKPVARTGETAGDAVHADQIIDRIENLDDWFSVPQWVETPPPPAARSASHGRWLILSDDSPLAKTLIEKLAEGATHVDVVRPGTGFAKSSQGYTVDPGDTGSFDELFDALQGDGGLPDRIIHCWSLSAAAPDWSGGEWAQDLVFTSAFAICRSLQMLGAGDGIRLAIATSGSQSIFGEATRHPERAALLAPGRVGPRELPGFFAQLIDLDPRDPTSESHASVVLAELDAGTHDDLVAYRDGTRLTQSYSDTPLRASDEIPNRLRQNGVYLITGGMGGIGLELAAYLARTAKARLALIGRNAPPPCEEWDKIIRADPRSGIADRLRGLLRLEKEGAELLILEADVTDFTALSSAVNQTKAKFGRIDGVFHGAGILDDAPMAAKSVEDIIRVMAPKILGGFALSKLLPEGELDFFAVFSSTSTIMGPAGQIDYVAANAALDALAASRKDGLAIDWGVWGDTGMAARAYRGGQDGPRGEYVHPLLGAMEKDKEGNTTFSARFDPKELWVINEHVVGGMPVLPGTGYIEMARAAMALLEPGSNIQIRNLSISAPLGFPNESGRNVRVTLSPNEDGFDFRVESTDESGGPMIEHAQAVISSGPMGDVATHADFSGAGLSASGVSGRAPQEELIEFGPRWRNIGKIKLGEDSACGQFELNQDFTSDLDTYVAHPALTDMATAVGLHLLADKSTRNSVFVPMSVDRIHLLKPLPAKFTSHATLKKSEPGRYAIFDTIFADENGEILAVFEGFTYRCVESGSLEDKGAEQPLTMTDRLMQCGITAADGPDLFARILNAKQRRIVVSSIPMLDLRRAVTVSSDPQTAKPKQRQGDGSVTYSNNIEQAVAEIWSDLLGVANVKPDDDFFDLGGHSLVAVRFFARVRKEFGVNLPLASLFQAPTPKDLSELIIDESGITPEATESGSSEDSETNGQAGQRPKKEWSPLVAIKKGSPERRPLFTIHGAGGNVLNFREISRLLDPDQPFYGLQARGSDGRMPPHDSIEEMAECYLDAIQKVQPNGPYLLAGYSGGGVIAYEIAQRLKKIGETVDRLVMLDSLSPALTKKPMSVLERLWAMRHWSFNFLLKWPQRKIANYQARIAGRQAVELARQGEEISAEGHDAMMFDEFIRKQRIYDVSPYEGSILIIRAKKASTEFLRGGRYLGWQDLVTGELNLSEIDCDHGNMMSEPAISEIARVVQDYLEQD